MDPGNDNLCTAGYVESVTTESVTTVVNVNGEVLQVEEKKKVRRRKRKPKINCELDTTDDVGSSVESNSRHTMYNEVHNLEDLLMQMVNFQTMSVMESEPNDAKHIAENLVVSLPGPSQDRQVKAKKQKPKKNKINGAHPVYSDDGRAKRGVVHRNVVEFLSEVSTVRVNGAGPVQSVLEDLVGGTSVASIKPKQKKQRVKKKTTQSEVGEHSAVMKPKKSPQKNAVSSSAKKKQEEKKEKVEEKFDEYFSEEQVICGLRDGTLISGVIRINQRNYKEAYISSPNGEEKDIIITGLKDRNRSLEGDEVVVMLQPGDEQSKARPSAQRIGKVVYIKDYVHPRLCVGHLQAKNKKLNNYVVFSPKDSRVPRLKIPSSTLPEDYIADPSKFNDIIFQARLSEWTDVNLAEGVIVGMIGPAGDIEVETVALLLDNNIDARPYPEDFKKYYPPSPFVIPEAEYCWRDDLRHECIFTIDPLTAKDLDDAVSLKNLPNGNFEVGVHISDVSYFIEHNTPLDKAVRRKATSVYLVQRVYHMLPEELCLMCSLSPGMDKLAFSVIFEMTPNAEVVSHRFTHSIIRSCTKFAYEHAQAIIDNTDKEWTNEDFPPICNGFRPQDCVNVVKNLYKLSVIMRNRRFDNGALRIDQPKLYFELDPETGIPIKWSLQESKEANRLIEEFMLLANGTVAKHIYQVYPDVAFLRHHAPPAPYSVKMLAEKLSLFGIHLDIKSAGGIHSSLMKYETFESNDIFAWARRAVMNNLCAKGMKRALYMCAAGSNDLSNFHHYALNVPFYTHFTSPIRRYPDIMVHRLLAASLGIGVEPNWTKDFTASVARNCNVQKNSAKVAGEQSSLLYLTLFLAYRGPLTTYAAVIDVKDHSFDVILYGFCTPLRIYTDKIEAQTTHSCNDGVTSLEIKWMCGAVQVIQLFSVVPVVVRKHKELWKLEGILIPPPPMPAVFLNSNPSNCV